MAGPAPSATRPWDRTRCPELECLRGLLPVETLIFAGQRALTLGVGADRVLIASGAITDEAYVRALAAWLGVLFEPLDLAREASPLPDERLMESVTAGLLLLQFDGPFIGVIAPQSMTGRLLASGRHAIPKDRFRLTSRDRLRQFVLRHGERALGEHAAETLRRTRPEFSAAACPPRVRASWIAGSALVVAAAAAFQTAAVTAVSVLLALMFVTWTGLRMLGAMTPWRGWRVTRTPLRDLPVYTIIVALYDEAAAVPGLIDALRKLDYPPEKLQVILVLEPDDAATQAALAELDLRPPFEILVAPNVGPRTKPKALNAALALARGEFTAVFDAEDRPERNQLHRALDAFFGNGLEIACVQARLTIDNTRDGWLAKIFTAEYSGLFDVLLPGLATHHLPLPLGGSSNHFRTEVLRSVGGWDPYNVTEDADLGMRLARLGFRAAVIDSTTYEEAPAHLGPWIRQRTRWFKGWIQTWLVHMRRPWRLLRELGPGGFVTFQLVVGGTVLSALVHPIFAVCLVYAGITGALLPSADDLTLLLLATSWAGSLLAGYSASAMLGLVGLRRRGLLRHSWALLFMPIHWFLLSWAAWRAVLQLWRDPFRWEKTPHGLAQTSRLAAQPRARDETLRRRSRSGPLFTSRLPYAP